MKNSQLYTEGCNFIRHYSNCSLTVRMVTLVQGLVLLSAWFYALEEVQKSVYLVLISAFGLIFTGLLFLLHLGYGRAAKDYTTAVINIERELIDDLKKPSIENGPVIFYREKRKNRYANPIFEFATVHAPFFLIGLAFLICFAYSLVMLISQLTCAI